MVKLVALLVSAAAAACQGSVGGGGAGSAAAGAGSAVASRDAALEVEADAHGAVDEAEPIDPGRAIVDLGAISAWQAVIDRAQLLARRGQHGVVFGRVGPALLMPGLSSAPVDAGVPTGGAGAAGARAADHVVGSDAGAAVASAAASDARTDAVAAPASVAVAADAAVTVGAARVGAAVAAGSALGSAAGAPAGAPAAAPIDAGLVNSPYVWLIDDTEGNGTLGIRIALGDKARQGDRIAAGGAWQLDDERRWFWKPDTVQPLAPAPPSDLAEPPLAAPSHAISTGPLPAGVRPISAARDNDAVYFQLVGPLPTTDGDGWQVADQLGSPTAALLSLPGERPSYGGQDMRSADERWQLKRGQTYWVRIGKLHKRADKPTAVNARTAPIRVQ